MSGIPPVRNWAAVIQGMSRFGSRWVRTRIPQSAPSPPKRAEQRVGPAADYPNCKTPSRYNECEPNGAQPSDASTAVSGSCSRWASSYNADPNPPVLSAGLQQ